MIAPYIQAAAAAPLTSCPSGWLAEVDAIRAGDADFQLAALFAEEEPVDRSAEPELAL